ncbi:MAG: hypothetical protein ACHREM_30680, partial [Polyangiales bacterium]
TTSFDGVDSQASGAGAVPTRPGGAAQASGHGVTLAFALESVHFGSAAGGASPNAWKGYGFDLDHQCTDATHDTQTSVCKPVPSEPQTSLVDGDGCRDNNFGALVTPLFETVRPTFESDTNTAISKGGNTWLVVVDDVDTGADDAYAPGRLFIAAATPTGSTPVWDGTDTRFIEQSSVVGGDVNAPVVSFPHGFIRGHVWVSGEPAAFSAIELPIGHVALLTSFASVVSTVVAFRLADDLSRVVSGTGTFAGALPMSQIEGVVGPFLGHEQGICAGDGLYVTTLQKVRAYPDVVVETATLQDPTKTCDGISFGIGLELTPVRVATLVVDDPVPPPDPCSPSFDGGTVDSDQGDGGVLDVVWIPTDGVSEVPFH